MVLLRVRSQGDALFQHTVVPWVVDSGRPLVDSLEHVFYEMRQPPANVDDFLKNYELWSHGKFLDVYGSVGVLGLQPGAEVFVKPRGSARVEEKLAAHRQVQLQEQAAATAHTAAPRRREEQKLVGTLPVSPGERGTTIQNSASMFHEFLQQQGLVERYGLFQRVGVSSLGDLCSRTSTEVAKAVIPNAGDLTAGSRSPSGSAATPTPTLRARCLAFRLITAAHETLVQGHVAIDWEKRLSELYQRYNPNKISQVSAMLEAYRGEEEDMWWALREKYESDVATVVETGGSSSTGTAAGGVPIAAEHHQQAGEHHQQAGEAPARPPLQSSKNSPPRAPPPTTQTEQSPHLPSHAQEAVCPACRHSFLVEARERLNHLHELSELQTKHSEESHRLETEKANLSHLVGDLQRRLDEANRSAEYHQKISQEQQQWLGLVEKKLSLAEKELAEREVNRAKGIPLEPRAGSSFLATYGRTIQQPPTESPSPPSKERNATGKGQRQPTAATVTVSKYSFEEKMKLRAKLVEFYIRHSPEKLELVDHVLTQWEGRESELERLIAVEPSIIRTTQGADGSF